MTKSVVQLKHRGAETLKKDLEERGVEYFFKRQGRAGGSGVIKFKSGRIYYLPNKVIVGNMRSYSSVSCTYFDVVDGKRILVKSTSFMSEASFRHALSVIIDAGLKIKGCLNYRGRTFSNEFEISPENVTIIRNGFSSVRELLDWLSGSVDLKDVFTDEQLNKLYLKAEEEVDTSSW